ncbi:uncharacterized protein BDZ99DRAFT_373361 [Mytilinidion resinicola]|uniref:F-box domain-containing protein n=1 Tax=Mytilinidion resinicola TaxID=574789 RepID=A0A6A6ZA87_9PEZI|nr:uncharacterized protein BDZ99DRAFT_373361 [Mytilinidion resinicola]KAF2817204.1 hypothetical protein BDZ99DRAFT_373361 [Mytilinidion resinicola]
MAHLNHPAALHRHTLSTSPVRNPTNVAERQDIPLHLLALIISFIDDVADIARLTRTSRLLYYMTLPRLYERVTLRSYTEMRYVNGKPEGYGSGSPFSMGLNALVSRNFTNYVQNFRVLGEWKESDIEDFSKGRVPDNSMMLNIALRAAIDKMQNIQSFGWELNTKPMQTVYQSLNSRSTLTSFTLRSPSRRIPRPTVLIPPIPNLKILKVYDIDPLCYPDDISMLLVSSKKLQDLTLHWSPRMRDMGEESVNMLTYFGRCMTNKHTMKLKRLSLYNMYTRNGGDFDDCISHESLEEVTFLNCMGSGDPMTVFLDDTWRINRPDKVPVNLKTMRGDLVDEAHTLFMARFEGLERIYHVSQKRSARSKSNSVATTPATPSPSSASPASTPLNHDTVHLASDYLAAIQTHHGRTIRHLLLSDRWALSADVISQLARSCPNLEQLGIAIREPSPEAMRLVVSYAPKLFALRMLVRPGSELADKLDSMDPEMHQLAMGTEMWRPEYANLRYVGFGDLVFELGATISMGKKRAKPDGDVRFMRVVKLVSRDVVRHIEIWERDSFEMLA